MWAQRLLRGLSETAKGFQLALQGFFRGLMTSLQLAVRLLNSYYETVKDLFFDMTSYCFQLLTVISKIVLFFVPGFSCIAAGLLLPRFQTLLMAIGLIYLILLCMLGYLFRGTNAAEIERVPRTWSQFFPYSWVGILGIREPLSRVLEAYERVESAIVETIEGLGRTDPFYVTLVRFRRSCKDGVQNVRKLAAAHIKMSKKLAKEQRTCVGSGSLMVAKTVANLDGIVEGVRSMNVTLNRVSGEASVFAPRSETANAELEQCAEELRMLVESMREVFAEV